MSDSPDFDNVTLPEVARWVWDVRNTLNGNGQKGLVKTVESHDTLLRILGATVAVMLPVTVTVVLWILGRTGGVIQLP